MSVRRLAKFLKNPELDPANVDYSPNPPRDGEQCCGEGGGEWCNFILLANGERHEL